jgi:hypothetical protein
VASVLEVHDVRPEAIVAMDVPAAGGVVLYVRRGV